MLLNRAAALWRERPVLQRSARDQQGSQQQQLATPNINLLAVVAQAVV